MHNPRNKILFEHDTGMVQNRDKNEDRFQRMDPKHDVLS